MVWISEERLVELPDDAEASPVMPEVVVELSSEENTETETKKYRRLDLEGGAQEV